MASMMVGDFAEAYVLKNAYKEKVRRLEAAEDKAKRAGSGSGSGSGEKKARGGRGGGLFGLIKKKVHPKAAASAEATSASSSS
ncbi:hypothetical protein ACP4OV_006372 [Aristida adscensionis]